MANSDPHAARPPLNETRLSWHTISHPGLVRAENEDSHQVSERIGEWASGRRYLLAVADGVGGHGGGSVASALAIEALSQEFEAWKGDSPDRFIEYAVQRANMAVFDGAHASPDLFNMQTTLTAAVVADDRLLIGHVGDCRLYRVRGGQLDLLTHDHSMVMEMLRMRMITPEQALDHPGRYQLTRSLGAELLLRVDVVRDLIEPGDRYVICCDGLWSEVSQEEVRQVLLSSAATEAAAQELLALALGRGAPDNITLIVAQVESVGRPAPAGSRWRALLRRG